MAWRCSGCSNAELISNLYRAQLITASRVRDAMLGVDRAHYCPENRRDEAYTDSPVPIGYSATISAPHMHASACESLLPVLGQDNGEERRILDIGSGSGYLTHVLANLNSKGKVVGVDHIQPLVDLAIHNMQKSASGRTLLDSDQVEIVRADGRKGYAAGGPYDAIHVGAAAVELHQDLIDQLKAPGRLFIPVEDKGGWGEQYIWVVDKGADGKVVKKKTMGVRYVPLCDAPA
ncbi:hypothetical protein BT93_L1415 [Corymbia citriodora subsp. variegata]|uniref:Protein-L-isoaspartate O-methyltransferase n=1 Tax=Corymbia citriodora subsp. variegata TaxID=360336 RepID=A0A8T0CF96_CORYI|nr:hypothetical protein BT93_L1415 [Corymbia citriodora subsp. variegata]